MAFFNTDELKKKAQEFYNKFFAKLKEEVEIFKKETETLTASQKARELEKEKPKPVKVEEEKPSLIERGRELKEKAKMKITEAIEFQKDPERVKAFQKEMADPLLYPKMAVKAYFYDPKIGVFPQFMMREGMHGDIYRLADWQNLPEKERKEELEKTVMPILALSGGIRATVSPGSRAYKQIIKEGWFRKKIDNQWAWIHPGGGKVVTSPACFTTLMCFLTSLL